MRVADYIFSRLESYGLKKAYLVTGRGALFLTDGLAKNGSFKEVLIMNNCCYAAVAEAQLTESPSLCLVSTGCARQIATRFWLARQHSVIFISGQNILNETTYYKKIDLRTFGNKKLI